MPCQFSIGIEIIYAGTAAMVLFEMTFSEQHQHQSMKLKTAYLLLAFEAIKVQI